MPEETKDDQVSEPSVSDNPLDAIEEGALEITDDAQYKLADGSVLSGKELVGLRDDVGNLQKGFTQSTQKYSQQLQDSANKIATLEQNLTTMQEYITALSNNNPATADDYTNYSGVTTQQIDPKRIAESVKAEILLTMKNERLALDRRSQEETELRLKEEEFQSKYPGIPVKDIIYKAQAAVEKGDFDGFVNEHLRLNKLLRTAEEKSRQEKLEIARKAYVSVQPTSTTTPQASKPVKRLSQSVMRDRIKEASKAAQKDIKRLENL